MIVKRSLTIVLFIGIVFFFSGHASADCGALPANECGLISGTHIRERDDQLQISWTALGQSWEVTAIKVTYLGTNTPVINVETDTGNESFLKDLPNCYYMGNLSDSNDQYATAYINLCPSNFAAFSGFVSSGDNLYGMDGTTMSLLETGDTGGLR